LYYFFTFLLFYLFPFLLFGRSDYYLYLCKPFGFLAGFCIRSTKTNEKLSGINKNIV